MELTNYELGQVFGYIGTFFSIVLFIPQVRHVYKTKDTYAINKCYLNLEIIGSSIKFTYAILIAEYPLIISSISVMTCIILIYIQKLKEIPKEEIKSNANIKSGANIKPIENIKTPQKNVENVEIV